MTIKLDDPVGAFHGLAEATKRYIESAFATRSQTFNAERRALLDRPGVLFQEPFIEPLLDYPAGAVLEALNAEDLPDMSPTARECFVQLARAGLFRGTHPLYTHQQRMLRESLAGKHCVVTTGTGSGKTESFLLPLIASIVRESFATDWPTASRRNAEWTGTVPSWDADRRVDRGETRAPALRALILYPMNALVEDQVSRLRSALDSDEVHHVLDDALGGNRIRFGRYNGTTPVAGHPFNSDGEANSRKRNELKKDLSELGRQWLGVKGEAREASNALVAAEALGDAAGIREAQRRREAALEVVRFTPRAECGAAEMLHRWEMQASPPDILITNVSMLSIMMMRHPAELIAGDRADTQILDRTREWLAADRVNHLFHLVVDELHLHRGSAGTEVAYLLRLLLDRLGLSPTSPQLRILASSASLSPDDPAALRFLGEFFGFTAEEVARQFFVEAGDRRANGVPALPPDSLVTAAREIGSALESNSQVPVAAVDALSRALTECRPAPLDFLLSGFDGKGRRATRIGDVFARWFPEAPPTDRASIGRGLLHALTLPPVTGRFNAADLPRFRLHWMARNIDGLWASPRLAGEDPHRTVGALSADQDQAEGDRLLEVLYCECCGTQFLCGAKVEIPESLRTATGAVAAGWFGNAVLPVLAYELTLSSPRLDRVPDSYEEVRTDAMRYADLGVIWVQPLGWASPRDSDLKWYQGSMERNTTGHQPLFHREARWRPASIDPTTGVVMLDADPVHGQQACLWFDLMGQDVGKLPAMPQRCPACSMDYSKRSGRQSPVRSFVTGLSKMSHLLTQQLYAVVRDGPGTRLVAFSDSRQAAADLAVNVDSEHWGFLLRTLLLSKLLGRDRRLLSVKKQILEHVTSHGEGGVAALFKDLTQGLTLLQRQEVQGFRNLVLNHLTDPELVDAVGRREIELVRDGDDSIISLDEVLGHPLTTPGPLWVAFLELGINPGGPSVVERKLGDRDWTGPFAASTSLLDRNPANTRALSQQDRADLVTLNERQRQAVWRAVAGRLLYDLEAQGVGYLSIPPDQTLLPPSTMPAAEFRQACNSIVRILSEEYRVDPHPFGATPDLIDATMPAGGGNLGPVKRRLVRFVTRVAERYGVDAAELWSAVARVVGRGPAGKWGIVRLSELWVKIVERDHLPLICGNCTRIHMHESAGVCSRCCHELIDHGASTLTSDELTSRHYYASHVKPDWTPYRLRTEELTGQTINQAQRQRHFRSVFLQDEEVTDLGRRRVIPEVDAIELLSVTTTMEVGVDIGALQAVFQSNMPPERFNYQQRVGRAGRKGQRFSAVLTYCRGQTHDRIHFDHPAEMTGGLPPVPQVATGEGQAILADRLIAKELLRRAFRELQVDWTSSGGASDANGEFGGVASYDEARASALSEWIATHQSEIEEISKLVSRGTGLKAVELGSRASELAVKIAAAVTNQELTSDALANRLAEAGILPMFGMPTRVRNLYFDLKTGPGADTEARSIDRDFDQAISDFAPGSRRTWEKRILMPIGLCGRIWNKPGKGWVSEGQPASAAYAQVYCNDCRAVVVHRLDPTTRMPFAVPEPPSWLANPDGPVDCKSCGGGNAEKYLAVAPAAFVTDFVMDRSRLAPGEWRMTGPARTVATTPTVIASALSPGVTIGISAQGRVYRLKRHRDRPYRFRDLGVHGGGPRVFGRIWKEEEDGPISAVLASSKTTDALTLRASNTPEIGFLGIPQPTTRTDGAVLVDDAATARRAAWYSAATIIQRATALELDIDSLDIDIAALHYLPDIGEHGCAELLLADAHPNGSGVVRWLASNVPNLVEGTLTGTGSLSRLGDAARAERQAGRDESWRHPTRLLRGFRNRSLHPLLDWDLGVELLETLASERFAPGLSEARGCHDRWQSRAQRAARRFIASFSAIARGDESLSTGWLMGVEAGLTLCAIVHPLWGPSPGPRNGLRVIADDAARLGASQVLLVSSFDLERRMTWVRKQLATLMAAPQGAYRPRGDEFTAMPTGTTITFDSHSYVKIEPRPLMPLTDGVYLTLRGDDTLATVVVRRTAGGKPYVSINGVRATGDVAITIVAIQQ